MLYKAGNAHAPREERQWAFLFVVPDKDMPGRVCRPAANAFKWTSKMGIFDNIKNILIELPVSDILRERLLLLEAQIKIIEEENINLKKKNTELLRNLNRIEKELADIRATEQFIEHRGMLFKRKAGGGYHKAAFCPLCRAPMGFFVEFYTCDRCNISPINAPDIETVLRELSD